MYMYMYVDSSLVEPIGCGVLLRERFLLQFCVKYVGLVKTKVVYLWHLDQY